MTLLNQKYMKTRSDDGTSGDKIKCGKITPLFEGLVYFLNKFPGDHKTKSIGLIGFFNVC